jgi:formate hydrogenlyase subunit 4
MRWNALVTLAILLVAAPAISGVVVKTKAILAGRRGPPVVQLYYDLAKLLRKQAVYGTTTTWVFRAGPIVMLISLIAAVLFVPLDGRQAAATFAGDMLAFAGLLALGRFALVLAALDTGSSFEGMGASREATFASFAEPALFLCLIALTLATGDLSMNGMFGAPLAGAWREAGASLILVGICLFVVLLAENSRVPFDDPATHLELTMIHEVMVLDHSGPDFAFIVYGGALKLATFAALVTSIFMPRAGVGNVASITLLFVGLVVVAVAVGIVESVNARLRLLRVPQLLVGAGALALFSIVLLLH